MYLHRSLGLALALAAAAVSAATAGPIHNAPSKITYKTAPPPPGFPPTSYTAVVNKNGNLVRGLGATGASQPEGIGTYEVDFAVDVTHCAYVATVGETGGSGSEPPAFITVVGRSGTPNGIFVETFAPSGKLKNFPFHVDVGC